MYKISDIARNIQVKVEDQSKLIFLKKVLQLKLKFCQSFLEKIEIIEVPIRYEARSYEDGKKIKLYDGIKISLKILKYCKLNI